MNRLEDIRARCDAGRPIKSIDVRWMLAEIERMNSLRELDQIAYEQLNQLYDTDTAALLARAKPANEPLTLVQLLAMEGEPIWCVHMETGEAFWALYMDSATIDKPAASGVRAHVAHLQRAFGTSYGASYKNYGKTWIAYRRQPERSENDG